MLLFVRFSGTELGSGERGAAIQGQARGRRCTTRCALERITIAQQDRTRFGVVWQALEEMFGSEAARTQGVCTLGR